MAPSLTKEVVLGVAVSTQSLCKAFDIATRMSKGERIKEEIGWLKVVFALAAAADASLIAWIAQNYDSVRTVIMAIAVTAALILSGIVFYVTRVAYRRLGELEDA
jgi:hypothetical protein